MSEERPDTIVVGAGPTGCAYAFWRRRAGESVVVLEERTVALGAWLVPGGGAPPPTLALPADLAAALALQTAPPPPPEGGRALPCLERRGRTRRRPPPAAWFRGVVPPWSRGARDARAQTLATWGRRHAGAALLAHWIAPQVRAAYGASPAGVGASDAWPGLLARHARDGIRGVLAARLLPGADGSRAPVRGGLPATRSALLRALGDAVRTRARVVAVEIAPRPAVRLADGTRLEADAVALAAGEPEQARLLDDVDRFAADDLRAFARADAADVLLRVEGSAARALRPLAGRIRTVGRAAGLRAHRFEIGEDEARAGVVWIRARLGGPLDPEVLRMEDDLLVRVVEADLARWTRRPVASAWADVARRPGDVPVPVVGCRARLVAHRRRLEAKGVVLLGRRVHGPSVEAGLLAGAPPRGPLPDGLGVG